MVNIDNNVTVVNAGRELDVSGLVADNKKVEGTLPASISNELSVTVKPASSDVEKEKPEVSKKTETQPAEAAKKVTASTNSNASKNSAAKTTASAKSSKAAKTASASTPQKVYWVQTASLTSRLYAEEARKRLQEKNFKAEIFTKDTVQGLVHRVRVGPFENKTEANYWLSGIKKIEGFEESFVSEEKVN